MSPLVSRRKVVQGRPSNKQVKRNKRKAERGVCRIQICCSGDQGYQTVGCGILIKYKIQQWKSKYLIATTDSVFQGGFDAKYRVDFIRSRSRLKTFMLDRKWITHHPDSGMIVIALDPHSPVFRRGLKRSSVITHRPFEVELFDNEDNAFKDGLCVHVVADAQPSELFGVKPHELIRDTTGQRISYILRNFNPATCVPFGGAILRRIDKKWIAVGVLNSSTTSEDRFLPIWLSETVFSNLKSGPPQHNNQDGSTGNAANPSTSSTGLPQQENQDGSSGNATNQRKEKMSVPDAVVRPPGAIPKKRSTQHRRKLNIEESYMGWDQQEEITADLELLENGRLHKAYHRNQQNGSNEKEELATGLTASRFDIEFSQTLGSFARATTPKLPYVTGRSSYISAGSQDTGSTGYPSEQDDGDIIQALCHRDRFMRKQLQAKSVVCDTLQTRVSSLEQNYKECKDQYAALQEQNKQLRQKNISLMSMEAESQELIGKLQEMLDWKQNECHQRQEECHQLREQLTTLRREVEELRENFRLQGLKQAGIGDSSSHDTAHSDCSSVSSGSASGELGDGDSSDRGD